MICQVVSTLEIDIVPEETAPLFPKLLRLMISLHRMAIGSRSSIALGAATGGGGGCTKFPSSSALSDGDCCILLLDVLECS